MCHLLEKKTIGEQMRDNKQNTNAKDCNKDGVSKLAEQRATPNDVVAGNKTLIAVANRIIK